VQNGARRDHSVIIVLPLCLATIVCHFSTLYVAIAPEKQTNTGYLTCLSFMPKVAMYLFRLTCKEGCAADAHGRLQLYLAARSSTYTVSSNPCLMNVKRTTFAIMPASKQASELAHLASFARHGLEVVNKAAISYFHMPGCYQASNADCASRQESGGSMQERARPCSTVDNSILTPGSPHKVDTSLQGAGPDIYLASLSSCIGTW
jgi:hypothetical protein